MVSKTTSKVGLIGCGPWGMNHLRVLDELGVLAVACDVDEDRRRAIAAAHPRVSTTAATSDVLDDPEVRAVVLAVPTVAHAPLAKAALLAGKDVLVEKPIALTVGDAEELCSIAEANGRILAVGHVLEYHPAVTALKRLVAEGDLGRVAYMYANRLNFGRIRTEENVLWSFAPHDMAILLRLLGTMPESISCHGATYLSAGVADVTLTQVSFPGGVRAHVFVSWMHPFKEHRFVVVGERRMAVFDDTAPWSEKLVVYEHSVDWVDGAIPVARRAEGQHIELPSVEPLRVQAEAFLEAIDSRVPPLADGRSGLAVLKLLDAAQISMERQGVPVDLGRRRDVFIHPSAEIDSGATIGSGTKIWHFVHVMGDAVIGEQCVLGQNVFVGAEVRIGDRVRIQNNVSVYEAVELRSDVFVGPSVVFTNVRSPRSEVNRRGEFERTVVDEGATLGANSTIVCGHDVGRYAFVGAGAVVTADVPAHALVVGNPARVMGWVCRCGVRLADENGPCDACGRTYQRTASGLREM
jgi:UDP-2-acetamido-3-amino-2,3-dideoxy-glucuronate N-acetyltransferase